MKILWIVLATFMPDKRTLCAAYVKYNYGGESAHQNPLFMKTNYILAAAWGLLYVLTAVRTFLLRRAGFGNLLIIVNNLIPILMGFFTMWFATGDATPPGRCHCLFFTIGTVNFSNLINQLSYTASFHSVICFPLQYQKEEAPSQQVLIPHQEHLSCADAHNLHQLILRYNHTLT